eukprot:m.191591 g.191591  ORF g.191591 m.191591 type:complete len:568 (-) comp17571_c1_seq1:2521-4224(-)
MHRIKLPRRKKPSPREELAVDRESFIAVSTDTIMHGLLTRLPLKEDRMRLIDLASRLERLYRVRLSESSNTLRRLFEEFNSPPQQKQEPRLHCDLTSQEQLEDEFMERLHATMLQGNYRVLSVQAYKEAKENEYMMDIELDWKTDRLDSAFIERFRSRHAQDESFADAAEVNEHVLVYHRGLGVDSQRGFFFMQKVGVILGQVLTLLYSWLLYMLASLKFWKYPRYFRSQAVPWQTPPSVTSRRSRAPRLSDDRRLRFSRQTIKSHMQASWTYLFEKVKIEEPTLKELVIVYRTKDMVNKTKGVPNIATKGFQDIPVSDFEVVLPEQEPQMRLFDMLKLIVAVVVAAGAVFVKWVDADTAMHEEGADLSKDAGLIQRLDGLLPVLIALGSYAVKLVLDYRTQQLNYNEFMTTYLYDRTANNGVGCFSHLLETTIIQEFKETLLAYFFLWQDGPSGPEELCRSCESFLESVGDAVDFDIADAGEKLLTDSLVLSDGVNFDEDCVLAPLPIDQAIEQLNGQWQQVYEVQDMECAYCRYLNESHHMHLPGPACGSKSTALLSSISPSANL